MNASKECAIWKTAEVHRELFRPDVVGCPYCEIARLSGQLEEAHKAVWEMAEDGWLYCGAEGYQGAQQVVHDYTLKYPRDAAETGESHGGT
jgi:hypothetical protein